MTMSAIAYALTFVTVRELSKRSRFTLVMLRAIGTVILLPWLYQSGIGMRTSRETLRISRDLVYSGNLCWFTRWRK